MNKTGKIAHWCLDLLFPRYCLGCGQEGSYLCAACQELLPVSSGANCHICGRRSPAGAVCQRCKKESGSRVSGIMVASDWNNLLLRQIIYEYKYRFIKELADPLAQLMIQFLKNTSPIVEPILLSSSHPPEYRRGRHKEGNTPTDKPSNYKTDKPILIPVPLHGRRLAWRGFNQSEFLAQKIGQHFNLPIEKNILTRARHTLPQREIKNKKNRAQNIKNAFKLSPKTNFEKNILLKNKIIILVDDICTTGATFEDCARALAPLGPKEIWGLVIARG